jgi:low affinity Fe/Cu permease
VSECQLTVPGMAPKQKPATDQKLTPGHLVRLAIEGAVGNAAWALLLLAAVVIAALLKGEVAAWVFAVTLVVALGVFAVISTALLRRVDRMEGARNEARRHSEDANRRAIEVEEHAEAEKRELREQLAAATGGQQAVSTRMQSIARQVDALASSETGYAYGPDESQVALLVGLLEDLSQQAREGDPIVTRLLDTWKGSFEEHSDASWQSALQV